MTLNLRALLEEMIQKDASDLHITAAETSEASGGRRYRR